MKIPLNGTFKVNLFQIRMSSIEELTILYWGNPIHSGVIFATGLFWLIVFSYYSLILVFAYSSLAMMMIGLFLKIYTNVMISLKKADSNSLYISKELTEVSLAIPQERVLRAIPQITEFLNFFVSELRGLFFLENITHYAIIGAL